MKWMNIVSRLLLGTFLLSSLIACAGGPESRSTGAYLDDASITTKVKTALITAEEVAARNVQVDTYKGVVQLSGFVKTAQDKQRAEEIASEVGGVIRVQNDLLIR
ncbi:MAG: BON domain-containing protein [Syntrophotaleaceae bacterium]